MIAAPMRALWLRLLLLAVFFNTAVGVPLHAAEHWHGLAGSGPVHAHGHAHGHGHAHDHDHDHDHADEHHHDPANTTEAADADHPAGLHPAHGGCTWCSSHAQLAAGLLGPAAVLLPAAPRAEPAPGAPALHAHATPPRWRYAARAPPRKA